MDPARYSALAHSTCPFAAPVHERVFDDLVAGLRLPPAARVLDLGCGKAELSARIAERWGADVLGIDRSTYALAAARERAARLSAGTLAVRDGDVGDPLPEGPWDLILNIGAMPPGTQSASLRAWAVALAPAGQMIIGDGYWKRPPDPGYLAALGASADDMLDLPGTIRRAADAGLEPDQVLVSPDADFEAYETAYRTNIERYLADHPDDVDADAMITRATSWWGVYERWGRETLGFVVVAMKRYRAVSY